MAFFKQIDDRAKEQIEQLHQALVAKKMWKPSSMLDGVRHIGQLYKKHTKEKVDKVLSWYCIHAGEEFVPRACTPRTFYTKYDAIVQAMERNPEETEEGVSEEAKRTVAQLTAIYTWPVEIEANLPAIVQKSLDNWRAFKAKLLMKIGMERFFVEWVVETHKCFVEFDWMPLIHKQVGRQEHYFGNSMDLAFRPDSKRFKDSIWRNWSYLVCGKVKAYDKLLEGLCK